MLRECVAVLDNNIVNILIKNNMRFRTMNGHRSFTGNEFIAFERSTLHNKGYGISYMTNDASGNELFRSYLNTWQIVTMARYGVLKGIINLE